MPALSYVPVTDGFSINHGNDTIIFEPLFGNRKARRVGIGNPDVMQMQWILSPAEYTGFMTFYYETLDSGALPFDMTLKGVTRSCRFIGNLQTTQVSGLTNYITANVEVSR